MTATTATPLESLAQRITRQQAELEALRREYESRQTSLADLNRKKETLQAQLRQVEANIQATTQGRQASTAASTTKGATPKPVPPRPQPKAPAKPAVAAAPLPGLPRAHTLPALLLEIVQKASGPITTKQLVEEVVRRKFPTTSTNLSAMVETRAGDLVRKGLLRRASDPPGLVPATSPAKALRGKPGPKPKSGAGGAPKAPAAKSNGQKQQLPLRAVLTNILAKNRKPMMGRELAEQALAGGYQTKSKNFIDVMWVALGQMDNIVNVPGKGYILKK